MIIPKPDEARIMQMNVNNTAITIPIINRFFTAFTFLFFIIYSICVLNVKNSSFKELFFIGNIYILKSNVFILDILTRIDIMKMKGRDYCETRKQN